MMPLKFVSAFIFVIGFSLFAAAQEVSQTIESEQNRSAQTRLFDEFGATSNCDLNARIYNIFVELGRNPGTRAYLILYRGSEALPVAQTEKTIQRQTKRIRDEINFMMLDAARLEIADGGFRKTNTVWNEVWFVPEGGAIPQPSATVEKSKLPVDKAFKVDERGLYVYEAQIQQLEAISDEETETPREENPETTEEPPEENAPVENSENLTEEISQTGEILDEYDPHDWISDFFAEQLRADNKLRGVTIFYADDTEYDVAKLRANIDEGMRKLAAESAVDLSGVKIIYGGYRKNSKIEFWIVPPGAKEPLPTPEEKTDSEF